MFHTVRGHWNIKKSSLALNLHAKWSTLLIYNAFESFIFALQKTDALIFFLYYPLHVRNSSLEKSKLFHSKRTFLLLSVWPGTEYTWALIWKKSLLICFESYQGIPYSHTGRVDSSVNTLLMVNINPIWKT